MTVQENIDRYNKFLKLVKEHPMCGKLEDDGANFIVLYPCGDFGVVYEGVSSPYRTGKADALERLLSRMERDWQSSFPGAC